MAWAQVETSGHMKGISLVPIKDSDGYWYFQFGPIRIYFGIGGSPTGLPTTAPIGSLALDMTAGQWYCADDAAGTFTAISTAMS